MFGGLRLSPSVRIALERRCRGACERCGLEWRWALYVFRVDESARCTAANVIVLCGSCSAENSGDFAPFVGTRSTRDRMLTANNRRAGVEPDAPGSRDADARRDLGRDQGSKPGLRQAVEARLRTATATQGVTLVRRLLVWRSVNDPARTGPGIRPPGPRTPRGWRRSKARCPSARAQVDSGDSPPSAANPQGCW